MMKRGNLMTFVGKMILIGGLLLEALLFAGVAYAQAPIPTPAPQPQTLVGRELAAGAQILADASNNVNALALLVIAASVVTVVLSVVMIIVLKGILDDKKRSDAAVAKREEAERREKMRNIDQASESVGAFTHAVNTFSVVTAGIARLETGIDALNKDRTESKQRSDDREKKYDDRLNTAEHRLISSLEHFGERMATETGVALKEGQAQAAQLLIDSLPGILAQAALAQAQAATPPPDAVDKIEIHAENVEVNTKDKGEIP
jgi:hypothetical protein